MNAKLFIKTLLIYLAKYGIKIININELAQKLYPYALKEEYQSLFSNINISLETRRVELEDILTEEEKEGSIKIFDNQLINEYTESNLEILNVNENELGLIDKIARELIYRHTFESSNFNIYGLNPNQEYACYHNGFYSVDLYTDGTVIKLSEEILGGPKGKLLYLFHQMSGNKRMKLKVANASYVALVGMAPSCTIFKLYTETLDRDKLETLKRNLMQDKSEELLKDKSIRVRKLKI